MEALMQMKGPNCEWAGGDSAINSLKATLTECMERGFIRKENIDVMAMTVWGMVHGWVSLAIRERFEKLVPKEQILPVMLQSLEWMIHTIAEK
jgi:hypothetical protein